MENSSILNSCIIKCKKCKNGEWIDNPNEKGSKICSKCGALYCTENRLIE